MAKPLYATVIAAVFVPVLLGLIGLINLINRPRFHLIHRVDALQLLVSGMCFGVALVAGAALVKLRAKS